MRADPRRRLPHDPPREVHNAIRYVLLNGRHLAAERGQRLHRDWGRPVGERVWFDGWTQPLRTDAPWIRKLRRRGRPTATLRTWLLTERWRKHGPLGIDEVPGSR